jgi:hypothetical protein
VRGKKAAIAREWGLLCLLKGGQFSSGDADVHQQVMRMSVPPAPRSWPSVPPIARPPLSGSKPVTKPPPRLAAGSWNIQNYGGSKSGRPAIVAALGAIAARYDVSVVHVRTALAPAVAPGSAASARRTPARPPRARLTEGLGASVSEKTVPEPRGQELSQTALSGGH